MNEKREERNLVANNLAILKKFNARGITKVKIPLREEVPTLLEIENHKRLLTFDENPSKMLNNAALKNYD